MTSGGDKTISMFRQNLTVKMTSSYAEEIKRLQSFYCAAKAIPEYTFDLLNALYQEENNSTTTSSSDFYDDMDFEESEDDIDEVFHEWYDQVRVQAENNDKIIFSWFVDRLEYITTALALDYPGLFIPYYFLSNYNVLSSIAKTFDITLPQIPKKADYRARVWHYAEICKALYRFRRENDISFSELCAFLYDFAPQYIGGIDSYIIKELPDPRSAYFIGGCGTNSDATAEDDPEMLSYWQCNPGTRAGDMIVMYLRTPISAISSIWRSHSVGFIDPFFYYYRCTYIGSPVKVNRLKIKEVKSDSVLGKMPIVLGNMQGINGVELRPSEYNHIVDISGGNVPRLEQILESEVSDFENEKAVEEKIIKPLISRLGYSEEEFVQQLYIEIGNHNHALIPDFVIHPICSYGHYSAFAVIEAKRSITNKKQLEETKTQVRSYAKMLGAKYSAIASKEKIWVMSSKDDYSKEIIEETWDSLKDADVFYKLNRLIGNK